MFHSPANGAGELFPSPAKRHVDPGLSGAQSSDAKALVGAALSGYYPRSDVNDVLATKEPVIADGGLAQTKVANLVSDISARATTQQLANVIATIASKASDFEIATRVVDMKTAIDRIKEQAANAE